MINNGIHNEVERSPLKKIIEMTANTQQGTLLEPHLNQQSIRKWNRNNFLTNNEKGMPEVAYMGPMKRIHAQIREYEKHE